MSDSPKRTRRYVLAERPATPTGPLHDSVLRYEDDVPVPRLDAGQVLGRVEWMSLDVATRGWMNDTRSYVAPAPLGEAMRALGAGTVSASEHPDFAVGDRVCGSLGWQEDAVVDGATLRRVPDGVPLEASLNILGIAGQTAWVGLHDIGQPRKGETVVVTAAAGGVGSIAVQLAVAAGARVIGVAGTAAKCEWVCEIGAEDCINYREEDVSAACARLCPDGVDVIFDNVGGATLDAILPHVAVNVRVVLCGAISRYEGGRGPAPLDNWFHLLPNRARMEGFIYADHEARFDEIEADLLPRLRNGELRSREHVVNGLTAAPGVLQMLFDGSNTGKLLVWISHP
ncbi:NADP-dependent oxidoreductase [Actinopolymorpha pittospori]|uniref:NADPH-dependent curcumin reductase CurA n=1 Tax=Actinopolymorpha pittospori TaxID=648752 RepID=A0A927N028_9ACTN|nr:NADP-dependent oxidoreductase [Actinopolymorpha pittospori]MBE1608453.1 NADPH-dependent curcumin reductase CurA [Actinopolymorpha pittospori]